MNKQTIKLINELIKYRIILGRYNPKEYDDFSRTLEDDIENINKELEEEGKTAEMRQFDAAEKARTPEEPKEEEEEFKLGDDVEYTERGKKYKAIIVQTKDGHDDSICRVFRKDILTHDKYGNGFKWISKRDLKKQNPNITTTGEDDYCRKDHPPKEEKV